MSSCTRSAHTRRVGGITLIELAVALGVAALVIAAAVPTLTRWQRDQRLKGAAHDVADVLLLARAEASRTGDRHVVYYGPPGTADPAGNAVIPSGTPAPLLVVLDDGAPAGSNCRVDGGEAREVVEGAEGVGWGVSLATVRAPNDDGGAAFSPPQASGGTSADPANNAVPWFLYRPDGVPVRFQGTLTDCGTVGQTALGGAGLYLTNGIRDYAVVVSAMGGVRVHVWDEVAGQWTP